jgi:ABC-type branched-subunit amino acid transport system permease subunit
MFLCDIDTVGATVHAWHLVLHVGLAGIVSLGGSVFLGLGIVAHRRTARLNAFRPDAP